MTPRKPRRGRRAADPQRSQIGSKAKKLPKETDHSGVIWRQGVQTREVIAGGKRTKQRRARQRKVTGKNTFTSELYAEKDFGYNFDARLLVRHISHYLLQLYAYAIVSGKTPDGLGMQEPLSRRKQYDWEKGRRVSPFRGYATGHMAANLRTNKISGSGIKSTTRILPPTNRNVLMATEAARGNFYFAVTGRANEVIKEATSTFIEAGMENKLRFRVDTSPIENSAQ